MKTILVVDDEPKITQLVRDYLERAGFDVLVAYDGKKALSLAKTEKPDMVVLDLGLPQLDGLDFTREFRKTSNAPIIMLTARAEESDKLIGLELGADDYMTKPFSPKELVARVRVVFRRIENALSANAEMIRVADLALDVPRMRIMAESRSVEELTPTEFELLATLARQPGRVFTRAQLLDAIHGVAFESYERAIDAHIKNIRRKIELKASEPQYILTVYGVGYKFVDK
jgi:DNA-binding response OmpR family regulator